MAANSTNGLVYDRAAQTQRVSIHRICDKRRLETLAVRPLIRQSYSLNGCLCPTCPQSEEGKITQEPEEAQSGELVFGRWMADRRNTLSHSQTTRTPKSDAPISKSTHLVMQRAGNTGASTGKGEPF